MVLTALRKCEPMWNVQQCRCTDEDFHTAMDMVKVLLEHSLLLSTTVSAVESGKEPKPMKKFYRIRSVLAKLPENFTYTQLKEGAVEHGIPSMFRLKDTLSVCLRCKSLKKRMVCIVNSVNPGPETHKGGPWSQWSQS